MTKISSSKNRGYGLLVSIVLLSLILLGLVVSENQQSLISGILIEDRESTLESVDLARSCVYIALARVSANPSYKPMGENVAVGQGTCTIVSVLSSGNAYVITATASSGKSTMKFSATAEILQNSINLSLTEIH